MNISCNLQKKKNNKVAQFYLGIIYYEGIYLEQNIEQALYYFNLSSKSGNILAKYYVGMIYSRKDLNFYDIDKSIAVFMEIFSCIS